MALASSFFLLKREGPQQRGGHADAPVSSSVQGTLLHAGGKRGRGQGTPHAKVTLTTQEDFERKRTFEAKSTA